MIRILSPVFPRAISARLPRFLALASPPWVDAMVLHTSSQLRREQGGPRFDIVANATLQVDVFAEGVVNFPVLELLSHKQRTEQRAARNAGHVDDQMRDLQLFTLQPLGKLPMHRNSFLVQHGLRGTVDEP